MAAEGDVLADQYRLVRRIGSGPHGDVFEAEQIGLARKVAIKIVTSDLDRNRLAREAKNAAKLDPRFVVPVLESRMDHDPPFVVSELARGKSLASLIGRPMLEEKAIPIVLALLDALAHAHAQSVFHGDLRPSNIFVERNGVQISDFGFAPEDTEEGRSATDLLSAKSVVGYRAPERLRGGAATARSDIFSVGVCLYEMIAAKRPFAGGAPVDEVASILGRAPAPIRARSGPVLARALAKEPTRRFESAGAMHAALAPRKLWPYAVATAIALPIAVAVYASLTMARIEKAHPIEPAPPTASVIAPDPVAPTAATSVALAPPVVTPSAALATKPVKPSRVDFGYPSCHFDALNRQKIEARRAGMESCIREENGAVIGDRFKVSFGDGPFALGQLTVLSTSGGVAFHHCMTSEALKVKMDDLPPGCYFTVTVH